MIWKNKIVIAGKGSSYNASCPGLAGACHALLLLLTIPSMLDRATECASVHTSPTLLVTPNFAIFEAYSHKYYSCVVLLLRALADHTMFRRIPAHLLRFIMQGEVKGCVTQTHLSQ